VQALPIAAVQEREESFETIERAEKWTQANAPSFFFSRPLRDNPIFLRFLRGQEPDEVDWNLLLRTHPQDERPLTPREAAEGLVAGYIWRDRKKPLVALAASHWPFAALVAFGWVLPFGLMLASRTLKFNIETQYMLLGACYWAFMILAWEYSRFGNNFTTRERAALTQALAKAPTREKRMAFTSALLIIFILIIFFIIKNISNDINNILNVIDNFKIDFKNKMMILYIYSIYLIFSLFYLINRTVHNVQAARTAGFMAIFLNPFLILEKALQNWMGESAKKGS
jgi:hypothetical protein